MALYGQTGARTRFGLSSEAVVVVPGTGNSIRVMSLAEAKELSTNADGDVPFVQLKLSVPARPGCQISQV